MLNLRPIPLGSIPGVEPLFVVGGGRSGTTPLQLAFNMHPELVGCATCNRFSDKGIEGTRKWSDWGLSPGERCALHKTEADGETALFGDWAKITWASPFS